MALTGKLAEMLKTAQELNGKSVKVGFFETSIYPNRIPVASVAIVHEFGAVKEDGTVIPPRPFFRNTIAAQKKRWFKIAALQLKAGKSADVILTSVGQAMEGDIRQQIDDTFKPELKERTLAARRARGNSSTKPLNDTGYMRDSLKFVIKED